MDSPRIALGIEYDGTDFFGWQLQKKPPVKTVEGELTKALGAVANEPVKVYCAGRTDSGVHGTSQVVHFDTTAKRPEKAWIKGVNTHLPKSIRVRWAQAVPEDFHARFSARSRTYHYVIYNAPVQSAVLANKVTFCDQPLNEQKMHLAAQALLGEQDFSGFQASGCQSNSSFRNVSEVRIERKNDFVIMKITANAFLLHMVRNIMGALMDVGQNIQPISWIDTILTSKVRSIGSRTAPAAGLYLTGVAYDLNFGIPMDTQLDFFTLG